jgi:hypothetical protein
MKDFESLGWSKSQSYYGGRHYWYKKDIYIHDNCHGTIQVGIFVEKTNYNSMIPFTFIGYQNHLDKDAPLNAEGAFELAVQIFDKFIESGFDYKSLMIVSQRLKSVEG